MFRAYHALPPLNNSKGQPTGAILGVINMLKKLINTFNPDWLVVVFDSKEPTFRHKLFKEYKINRVKMPEDLAVQISYVLEIITALGIHIIQIPGLEADDIIGTLVTKVKNLNIFSIISTGDKDLTQLVNDDVFIINTMTDLLLDPKGVIEKFKIPSSLIIDYLALIGDKVDNIPGVNNIGPKTAVKLLNQYKNLSGILSNVDQISGKVGENLKAVIEKIPLYIKLITIDTNLDIDFKIDDFKIKEKNLNELVQLLTELEIHSWLKDIKKIALNTNNIATNLDQTNNYNNNFTNQLDIKDKIKFWIDQISKVNTFAVHFKYKNLDLCTVQIEGIYLAVKDLDDYIEFIDLNEINYFNKLKELLNFLTANNKLKVVYNLKNLIKILDNYNISFKNKSQEYYKIEVKPPFIDVMLESYISNSSIKLNLDSNYTNAKQILSIHTNLDPKFNNEKLNKVLHDIEMPLAMVLFKMEKNGVLIDINKLNVQRNIIQAKIDLLEDNIYKLSGVMFNLNSPKQLQEILYVKLNMPILEKTPKGQPSTAESVLEELSTEFELPNLILQYRTLSKLQSTYIDKLPKMINQTTGRVHTTYNQNVTVTGRLSSSEPNLQNIPIKTLEGRSIRKAFIAKTGFKILSIDYSQIELRILAHLSEDLGLINAFNSNIDIHIMTASEIFKVEINNVTDELRRKAKAINFGLIYGMSEFGLSKQLKISHLEASEYIKNYFHKFPKVLDFMEITKKFAKEHGFVETMFGRRLYLPEINSRISMRRKAAERAAINAPMQGAQADLIKLAMINIDHWIINNNYENDILMLMQVHDELVFEVKDRENLIDIAKGSISKFMTEVVKLNVKLQVECGVADNWGDAH